MKSIHPMRILIVEDEESQAQALGRILRSAYAVDTAVTVAQGSYFLSTGAYDLMLLDIGLPDAEGITLCSYARSQAHHLAILMLSGYDDLPTKVRAFDQGADDYLCKPYSAVELLARIRALLRRPRETLMPVIRVGELTVDSNTRQAQRSGTPLKLSSKQFSLLEHLIRQSGKPLSREALFEHSWDRNADAFTNVVDVHIKMLRDKLDRPYEYKMVHTVSGFGYQLLPLQSNDDADA